MRTLVFVLVLVAGSALALGGQAPERSADADWPTYNRDLAGTRYSPLDQINTGNVSSLREVWTYRFHPEDGFVRRAQRVGAVSAGDAHRG